MTEQTSIDPTLWRTVADELDRIASAEWPSYAVLVGGVGRAVQAMPEGPQRREILRHATVMVLRSEDEAAANIRHRWHLRALAGALRAEVAGRRTMEEVQAGLPRCPNCGRPTGPYLRNHVCGQPQ